MDGGGETAMESDRPRARATAAAIFSSSDLIFGPVALREWNALKWPLFSATLLPLVVLAGLSVCPSACLAAGANINFEKVTARRGAQ